jgi:hypothetical protein
LGNTNTWKAFPTDTVGVEGPRSRGTELCKQEVCRELRRNNIQAAAQGVR